MEQGNLSETITWKLDNGVLTISGTGTLSWSNYLHITAPNRDGSTTVFRVLPWAVSPSVRAAGRIWENTPVSEIPNPNRISKVMLSGKIEGFRDFVRFAEESIGSVSLQPSQQILQNLVR